MAIFAREQSTKLGDGAASPHDTTSSVSVVAPGTRITGDLETTGVLKIEGVLDGNIRSAHQVLLGRQGTINGNITGRDLIIGGRIEGTITATERVEIQGGAVVQGDIRTRSIIVHAGAMINGAVHMGDDVTAGDEPAGAAGAEDAAEE